MNFEAFKKIVEEAKKNNPVWFRMESDQRPTDTAVTDAEARLGTELPADYKNFIYEYGGGYFAFSNVYSLENESDWNLVHINYRYNNICNGYVLVSENGSGDFYGFKIVDGICQSNIYFYDHEIQTWQTTEYKNLFEYLEALALTK